MMTALIVATLLLYGLSTVAYLAYLFRQKNLFYRWGHGFLCVGFGGHTALIAVAFMTTGSLPVHNLHQTLSLAGWTITGVFLFFHYQFKLKILGVYVAPLATLVMGVSARLPVSPEKVQDTFKSFWLIFHVVVIFMGEAAFALACGVGILYLFQESAIKTKKRGFFYKRLPSLDFLDSVGYTCIVTGFTLLTVGLIGGFVYAKAIWGHFWSWDPKEVWSGVTWLFYAALLHERLTVGWRGRKSAIMSIIGFGVILFTFLGVNFFLKGHHGEFTQW